MKYRDLGSTGLRVSEIGFGTGGNAGLMVDGSLEQQLDAIGRAIELGINYFDASPDYGDGVSEVNLGRALRELNADPIITTKVEVRAENLDDIAGHVERSVEASLKRLGRERVDIVQIHNGPVATRPELRGRQYNILGIDDYLDKNGALEGLERIQRSGKTRFIGFICRGNDGDQVKRLIDTGKFHLMNVIYTLLNPTAVSARLPGMDVSPDFGQVIPYGAQRGVGSAIYSPLAGGLLTDQVVSGGTLHPLSRGGREGAMGEARQRLVGQASRFRFLSRQGGASLAQAATRFILMEPGVSTVLGGFSDAEQVEEIAAASEAGPLSPEELEQVHAVWRTNFSN
jgi:L-glyceraldehyde 3-phosphate reductase